MIDDVDKDYGDAKMSPVQLARWYKELKDIQRKVEFVMLVREKYKGGYVYYRKRTVAMVVSGIVILIGCSFSEYARWAIYSGVGFGLTAYCMIMKLMPTPSNDKEYVLNLIKTSGLPVESNLTSLPVTQDTSAEFVFLKLLKISKKEMEHIQEISNYKL